MALNIKDIAAYVAANNNMSKAACEMIVKDVFDAIKGALTIDGTDVNIDKFGKFSPSERAERTGRNPATGESITIPAKTVIKFKPAKALKDEAAV